MNKITRSVKGCDVKKNTLTLASIKKGTIFKLPGTEKSTYWYMKTWGEMDTWGYYVDLRRGDTYSTHAPSITVIPLEGSICIEPDKK